MKPSYKYIPIGVTLSIAMTASAVFAADPPLAFRNIKLGDTLASVQKAASNEFAFASVREPKIDDIVSIVAGDSVGAYRDNCPVAAPPSRELNCLNVRFNLWPGPDGLRLSIITVAQSFSPPILPENILNKLQETYGAPRRKYEKAAIAPDAFSEQTDDIALVWGGRKTPHPPFRPATFILANDYSLIGGKYITAVVYRKGGAVSGYQLQIVDSDRVVATMEEWKAGQTRNAAAQQQRNTDSLKF